MPRLPPVITATWFIDIAQRSPARHNCTRARTQLWAIHLNNRRSRLDNTAMPQRSAVVLIAIVILGSLAEPRSQSDPMAPLAGTWGQPPIDGKPGLTGSI